MPAIRSPGLKVTTLAFQVGNVGFKSHWDHLWIGMQMAEASGL